MFEFVDSSDRSAPLATLRDNMASFSTLRRFSFLALAAAASAAAACGDTVPLYAYPRAMCGETAIQGASGGSKTDARSTTLATSDGERVFWVEDDYNVRGGAPGVIHAGSLAGGDDVVLATDALLPTQIVVDDEQLYWGGGASVPGEGGTAIKAIDKHGGTPRVVATVEAVSLDSSGPICQGGAVCPYRLAVDATDIYYNANNSLRRVDKRRLSSVPAILRSGIISSVAVDATHVYWIECSDDRTKGSLMRLAKNGDRVATSLAQFAGAACQTSDKLVVDDAAVYWEAKGTVSSIPKAGGTPTVIAEQQFVSNLTASGPNLYWVLGGARNGDWSATSGSHHALLQAPKVGGGGVVDLVAPRDDHSGFNDGSCDPLVVSVDDKSVFWVVPGGVLRRPLPGAAQ